MSTEVGAHLKPKMLRDRGRNPCEAWICRVCGLLNVSFAQLGGLVAAAPTPGAGTWPPEWRCWQRVLCQLKDRAPLASLTAQSISANHKTLSGLDAGGWIDRWGTRRRRTSLVRPYRKRAEVVQIDPANVHLERLEFSPCAV